MGKRSTKHVLFALLWRYSNFVLIVSASLTLFVLYKYPVFSTMVYYRAHIAYASLVCLIPFLFVVHRYKYTLRGGNRRCLSTKSLRGKTIIITGGNSGIGKGAAVDLASRGARVIVACRNATKAQEAVNEIKARSGNTDVIFRKLDLSSFKSVREFADRIIQEEERLDVLINNAGIPDANTHDDKWNPLPTEDGLSQSFQINHFGHFLLTTLLLDLLKKSSPSRVVNVTSRLNTAPKTLDFTVGDGNIRYPKLTYYSKGKLANVLFTSEFSERLKSYGVTSFAVDPGAIFTNICEKQIAPWKVKLMAPIFWLLFCNEDSGAYTTVFCAVEDGLESGQVYFDCRLSRYVNPLIENTEMKQRLWDVSMEVTGLKD